MIETGRTVRDTDIAVGARIAERRAELGLTQSDLGRVLGITFQQVQKYESGVNRVSASKLWMAAQLLELPINAFFPETAAPEADPGTMETVSPMARKITAEAHALSARDQRIIVALLKRLTGDRTPDQG